MIDGLLWDRGFEDIVELARREKIAPDVSLGRLTALGTLVQSITCLFGTAVNNRFRVYLAQWISTG